MPITLSFKALTLTAALLVLLTTGTYASSSSRAPQLDLQVEQFTLNNGLRVILHQDRKAPVVAVSVWYRVGARNEPSGRSGFAHLFEHLMFNGSENYDDDWFEPMQLIGATGLNGTTSVDRTNYFQTVPTPALELILAMESDRMGHLLGAVTQAKLENQRGVVQNEKRQRDNSPYGRINYALYEGLFPPGHPYRQLTIGSMEDLNAASLEDVRDWFNQYYGPNNAILTLAGDIDPGEARAMVERAFGDIPPGPEIDDYTAWIPVRTHNTYARQHDEVSAVLANRAWVIPGRTTREHALLELAAAVLGQGKSSRLYLDLIYDKQLASTVAVSAVPYELASVFDMAITLNPGTDVAIANEAMDQLVAEFVKSGPTAQELERVVTRKNAGIIRGLEQVGGFRGKAVTFAEGALYADDPLFIEQHLEWINSATPADVRDAAATWLTQGYHQVDVVPVKRLEAASMGIDRQAGLPPAPTDMPLLRFPQIRRATLSNGIEVAVAERHTIPVVEFAMEFDAGYAADAGGTLGLASFAMTMLETGTERRGAREIAETEERLGAQINARSNLDSSSVTLSALKDQLQPSLELWADLIRNPRFDEDEISRLRGRWIANIAKEKAQPQSLALRLLPTALYPSGHAYALPLTGSGTEASIESITRDDLMTFRTAWLRPDNARLFIVGDTSLEEIVPLLERVFRGWRAPKQPVPQKDIAAVERPVEPRVILIDKPGAVQSIILGGTVIQGLGSDQDIAMATMNDLIGGNFNSRINMNLREDKGWSYGARTALISAQGPRPMVVTAPVQTDRTGDSLKELLLELQEVAGARPVQANEIQRVVAGATRELPGRFETARAVLNSMLRSSRYDRPLDFATTLAAQYEDLTVEEVRSAAETSIDLSAFVWVIVGDLASIRSQVESLDIAEIEVRDENGVLTEGSGGQ